ncbi:hypothetical protein FKM82_028808, partial [Ascaphus truei]
VRTLRTGVEVCAVCVRWRAQYWSSSVRSPRSADTQRHGLVFIYDMGGSHYSNFDLELSKKILSLLRGAFPARLKKVLIVAAPVWFRVPYSVISLLLQEKLRERV